MRILVDEAIWGADQLFHDLGEVRSFIGRTLRPADVADAQAMIVRSVTPVGPDLLADSQVRFVGSAVSGDDHLDLAWLGRRGITVATAAGCNTRTVAEYVLASLLHLSERHGFSLPDKTLGIVGVGRIGSLVAQWCDALGVRTLLCDPIRAATVRECRAMLNSAPPLNSDEALNTDQFLPIDEIFHRTDIVTLHVPLTREGPHATQGLVGGRLLSACKHGLFLINTARGEVLDEAALIAARITGRIAGAVIDVWRNEPRISRALVKFAEIATPHIAGYSAAARRRGAEMIHRELARFCGQASGAPVEPGADSEVSSAVQRSAALPNGRGSDPRGSDRAEVRWEVLRERVRSLCDLESFDRLLRGGHAFDDMRRLAADRREFPQGPPVAGLSPIEAVIYETLGLGVGKG